MNYTEKIIIDKNVPYKKPGARRYPFDDMQVGDSFARPVAEAMCVRNNAGRYKKKNQGWSFTTKIQGAQIRLWRTA